MTVKEIEASVARLSLTEGDVVIIRCAEILSQRTADYLRERVDATLRSVGRAAPILILDKGLSIEILAASKLRRMPLEKLVVPDD